MTSPTAPTTPFTPTPHSLGIDDGVAQAFRSAAHAYHVQAAALFRAGRMVAFASPEGTLSMEEVAPAVATSTDVATRGPVTRFYTPPGSETDFVLYATPVRGDIALAAFFTMDTPLGNARRSGQALVQAIVRVWAAEAEAEPPAESAPAPPSLPRDWVPEKPSEEMEQALFPASTTPPPAPPAEPTPTVALPRDWVPSSAASEDRFPFLQPPPPPPPAAAPREIIVQVAPASTPGAPLLFSLVLVPRFPEHRLGGPLVDPLRGWIHRLCLAWDWRAEHVDIQPDRLALILSLPPETAPAQAVQQLRDGLASRLLQTFPHLAADLPSGRFWASAFLLASGPLAPEDEIAAFIRETRRSQGFKARD
ncbi:MAG TPA: transposase [Anaerolineales bacterium]|nr:transposase [Anaerolineales bacterium]